MRDRYRHELERLGPRQEELDRLYDMIEGGTEMKQTKRLSRRAAAILVCAVLTITAAAAAAVPAVWEGLLEQLGLFAPYAQTIDGAVCRDQGIEVRVLSALSDDLEARFYLSVRDVEGDRLNEYLNLRGQLKADAIPKAWEEDGPWVRVTTAPASSFKLLSYDPETRTALFSTSVRYAEEEPGQGARLSLTGMTTREMQVYASVSCAGVTGRTLDSLPVGEGDRVVFRPDSISNSPYTDAVLPDRRVVLAPEQNPMPLEGTEEMWVSSMGFAGDGCFHIRLGFSEGIGAALNESGESLLYSDLLLEGKDDGEKYTFQATLVPGGMDILYPLIVPEDLELLRAGQARVYGTCTRPGTELEGEWSAEFQLEHHRSVTLDWAGELAGRQVQQVTVSPLSVTITSADQGGFSRVPLYAVRKDGSTVAAEPGSGRYSNRAFGTGSGEPVWEAYNTWRFEEPVDLEELACLTLLDETIPVEQG